MSRKDAKAQSDFKSNRHDRQENMKPDRTAKRAKRIQNQNLLYKKSI